MSVPRSVLGTTELPTAQYVVAMMSHAGDGEGTGHVRPVYDRAYWDSTAGTDMSWIHDYRFGGGAGVYDGTIDARDTDIRDPNIVDVIVPGGAAQSQILDWRTASPVTLPYVPLS
jgi:hypothetical protein